jgi:predicted nicotinamide N-methyase
MEGICDMFQVENEESEYKLKPTHFEGEINGVNKIVEVFEMDGKEESVLIGEALWNGSKVLSRWIMNNPEELKDKNVLEIGSGVGLAGLVSGLCSPKSVILTDYKPQVMELISKNIDHFNRAHNPKKQVEVHHSMLDWYFGSDPKYLSTLPVYDENMNQISCFQDTLKGLDLIIGSDLIYFPESMDPLILMIEHFFSLSTSTHIQFIMCMKIRGQDLFEKFIGALKDKFETNEIDITDICEEFDNINAKIYCMRPKHRQM